MEANVPAERKTEWLKNRSKVSILNPIAANMIRTGFLAQDVEKSAKEINYNFSGVFKPEDENGIYGLDYAAFVPSLVKAAQQQESAIQVLKKTNECLVQQNTLLTQRLDRLEQLLALQSDTRSFETASVSMNLQQNVPNPFSTETRINYSIIESGLVSLKLYDANGKEVMILENNTKMSGTYTVNLDGKNLKSGLYYYRLSLNGKELTKEAIHL